YWPLFALCRHEVSWDTGVSTVGLQYQAPNPQFGAIAWRRASPPSAPGPATATTPRSRPDDSRRLPAMDVDLQPVGQVQPEGTGRRVMFTCSVSGQQATC